MRVQKIISLFFPLFLFGFLAVAFFANAAGNLSGYAWADDGIGWMSFNCTNAGVCGTSNYSVTVNPSGAMSGYAWANPNDGSQNNIGWVDFAPSGPYPASSFVPAQSVRLNRGSGSVTGWARAITYGGGWDGWIGFGSGGNYGSGVFVSGCNWSGYAWGGGTVMGWIHFSGAGYGVLGSDRACTNLGSLAVAATLNGSPWAGSVDYTISGTSMYNGSSVPQTVSNRVGGSYTLAYNSGGPAGAALASITPSATQTLPDGGTVAFTMNFTAPPIPPGGLNIDAVSLNTCQQIRLTWSDVPGEDKYQVERSDGGWHLIGEPVANDTDFVDTTIAQNTSYSYRVRACNAFGCSGYSGTVSGNNQSPTADFTWTPPELGIGKEASFNDDSTAYGGATINAWQWTFQDGTPPSSTEQNPSASFGPTGGQKQITLRATDSNARVCTTSQLITVRSGSGSPQWIEEPPVD